MTMNTRERFHAVVNFRPFDHLPMLEWAGWWGDTLQRWHVEGLPTALTDRYDICRHFGLDVYWQDWFPPRKPSCPTPTRHGAPVIQSLADYEAIRPHLFPAPEELAERWKDWEAAAWEQARGDAVLWFTLDGFFWFARTLLGIEPHIFAFYDQPDLLHRINADLADWHLKMIEHVCTICTPDFMTFGEDRSLRQDDDEQGRGGHACRVRANDADRGARRVPDQLRSPDPARRVARGLPIVSAAVQGVCV